MARRVAVVLSGCGVNDGTEIQEAVLALLALDQLGASYQCCAPDKLQVDVIDHLTGKPVAEERNVLTESARIARGKIVPLSQIKASDFDTIFLPGGFGAAKNLCSYAADGSSAIVDEDLRRILREFHDAGKPIGAVCIAPVVLAAVFSDADPKVKITIGTDKNTASDIEALGGNHETCPVTEFIVDEKNKIVTSPAYMLGKGPVEIFEGIRKTIGALMKMI